MSEELNPNTLDLIGVLSGRDYPELEIDVYFNEALGFSIYQLEKMLKSVEIIGSPDEVESLQDEIRDLIKKSEDQKYKITLKAVPESVYRGIMRKVQEEFPVKTDLLGREEANPKADEEFTKQLWHAYIVKVTAPDGAVKAVDKNDVDALLANAPATVHEKITSGISELRVGAKAGFEYAAREVDFLSQASPEG